ncbi:MAG: hypothetical protein ACXAEN_12270 [Candidatus Thorarchaeota archaeon]|jgi:hypothetical protein
MKVDPFWIWLAGFVDGEGCISVTRRKGKAGRENDRWYYQPTAAQQARDHERLKFLNHRGA